MHQLQQLLAAPLGLGTSAFHIPGASGQTTVELGENAYTACDLTGPARELASGGEIGRVPSGLGFARRDTYAPLPYLERAWGDGSHSPLYCPATARIDEALGEEVNRRLVAWAERVGIHEGRMDKFRDTGFGRLAMLTHPDSDDPDMLLVAAQMNAAWWAADDYYADETPLGATPTELPPRLALVMSAMDPPPHAGSYTEQLEEAVTADPVLVALRSATAHLTSHATPSQVMRACNTTFQMYVSWTAYAAWRYLETPPAAWRYLAARQHDSFYTSMTLIDVVGSYELTGNLFYDKRFHRALMQAGTASVLVNDLYSAEREAADELPDSNLVLLIAAEENCSLDDAIERTVALHNDFVRGFETAQRELSAVPSLELHRFLRGAQAWMAGGLEWHSATSRYKSESADRA
ncbi:family 2 encapsulin nanocompartment cargo protein terpene cyclase [Nocardia sp. NPDC049149]|uniref:family 2 encapsulin nanocompartment cargo protein terpene cyclase n=1 Tax=Nocardia sp. NPDC049149 TaxID=3364315 RepID=UPI00371B6168